MQYYPVRVALETLFAIAWSFTVLPCTIREVSVFLLRALEVLELRESNNTRL